MHSLKKQLPKSNPRGITAIENDYQLQKESLMTRFSRIVFSSSTALLLSAGVALADDAYTIVIKEHTFSPETLEIPAGKKVKLTVDNQDATPEEFESHDFNREKIIRGNSKAVISVGPLEPGEYVFFGEFNPKTAQGKLIVK